MCHGHEGRTRCSEGSLVFCLDNGVHFTGPEEAGRRWLDRDRERLAGTDTTDVQNSGARADGRDTVKQSMTPPPGVRRCVLFGTEVECTSVIAPHRRRAY